MEVASEFIPGPYMAMNSTSCVFYPWSWDENAALQFKNNAQFLPNFPAWPCVCQQQPRTPHFSGQAVWCPLKIPMSGKKGRGEVGGILMFHEVHKLQPDSKGLKYRLTAKGIQYSILQSEWRWSKKLCLKRQTLSCPLHFQTWKEKYKRSLCCRNCQPSFPWGKYFLFPLPTFFLYIKIVFIFIKGNV